ncbi:hypothetical protein Tco_1162472 [Tanacetum coccineum]
MADLEFVDQHNMVACLEKTGGNSEFHEIVDFLTSSLIQYALYCSPTIYISYIEQFWNTASSQTVNDEKQIHATVNSKAVVVIEASIRSSLLLNDADGTNGRDYMETEDVVKEGKQSNETEELNKGSGEKGGSTEELVSTAKPKIVSTARPDIDAARQEDSAVKDIEDSSRLERSILTLKPLSTIDPKDKAKVNRQTVTSRLASRGKLQQEEREEYTIKERAKFLAETIVAQRKFKATQRSSEIRSRPPTKSQLRNLMMTYLKNMGGYKHSQLKAKTFAKIQGLYERQKRVIDDFKPMDSDDAVKDSKEADGVNKQEVLEEPNSTKVEVKQEGHEESIRKRPDRRLKMKATKKSKRQKTDVGLEEESN